MLGKRLYEVQDILRDNGILISFSGKLSQGLIEEYGEAVKKYMESEERTTSVVFNVFAVFIEQTQNIKNYAGSKEGSQQYERIANSSIVTIGKSEAGHYICSGNIIETVDLEPLLSLIDRLVSLDKAELKKLYKEKLQEPQSESGGAGLGIIEMARKASKPLQYSVTRIDATLSFFTLNAIV
ncbi:MAG: hypothetical protein K0R57_4668 [Paenibacillaceae bacterium]|jgi:hypothetical protein|nr:hypothetical protein [Paenibacillaceae bacterium]